MESSEIADRAGGKSRWPPWLRLLGVLAFFGLVGFAVWVLQGGMSPAVGVPRVGSSAPNFTLERVDGQKVSLESYRGRTVIVNFWATWCPPCRSEMPAIDAAAKADPGVVVLAVDLEEGPLPVRAYAEQLGLSFSPLLDTSGKVTALYHVDSLPSSFFIGADGTVRAINVGAMDQRMIDADLKRSTS
ncbi:MAG: TlpA family protein disulfide reductase [Chloroflexota bacterium]